MAGEGLQDYWSSFFLIYVNDIAENLLSITRLFADDTSLAFSSSDVKDTEGIWNHDLRMIASWAKQWLVSFNPSKTVAILFSTVLDLVKPSLILNNTILYFVDNNKHLGLTLSSDGKWHAHIDNILTSASRTLGTLRSLKYKFCRKTLNQIYLSYPSLNMPQWCGMDVHYMEEETLTNTV